MSNESDGLDWFDTLYRSAAGNAERVPWAKRRPNPNLVGWLEREQPAARGATALVVGCGLGDDAELLARWGFAVTAFDLSPTAIEWCRERFPDSRVRYLASDLLAPPADWVGRFQFVFEAYTLQAMPPALVPAARTSLATLVARDGRLLIVARGRDADECVEGPPWPLTRAEIGAIGDDQLRMESFEDYEEAGDPPIRRFRAVFGRVDVNAG